MVEPNQTAGTQAVASPIPEIWPPAPPAGFEEFFRSSFRELVRAEPSLAYARKATVHTLPISWPGC